MKQTLFSVSLLTLLLISFACCGGKGGGNNEKSESGSDNGQITLGGTLADYYDVSLSYVVNEEETKAGRTVYNATITFTKNAKEFDFDPNSVVCNRLYAQGLAKDGKKSLWYEEHGSKNLFYIECIFYYNGESLWDNSFLGSPRFENLLSIASKPGSSKTVSAKFFVDKNDENPNIKVELMSYLYLGANKEASSAEKASE